MLLNKALKIIFKSTCKVECLIEVFRLTTWRWPRLHVVNDSSPVDIYIGFTLEQCGDLHALKLQLIYVCRVQLILAC